MGAAAPTLTWSVVSLGDSVGSAEVEELKHVFKRWLDPSLAVPHAGLAGSVRSIRATCEKAPGAYLERMSSAALVEKPEAQPTADILVVVGHSSFQGSDTARVQKIIEDTRPSVCFLACCCGFSERRTEVLAATQTSASPLLVAFNRVVPVKDVKAGFMSTIVSFLPVCVQLLSPKARDRHMLARHATKLATINAMQHLARIGDGKDLETPLFLANDDDARVTTYEKFTDLLSDYADPDGRLRRIRDFQTWTVGGSKHLEELLELGPSHEEFASKLAICEHELGIDLVEAEYLRLDSGKAFTSDARVSDGAASAVATSAATAGHAAAEEEHAAASDDNVALACADEAWDSDDESHSVRAGGIRQTLRALDGLARVGCL